MPGQRTHPEQHASMAGLENLLFEFELEMEQELGFATTSAEAKARITAIERALAALSPASDIIERRLLRDVCWLNRATVQEDGKLDIVVLASKLVNMGYKVSIRTAVGGGSGQDCFHNLHHEFLIVSTRQQQLIVDCSFKDQFSICQQTQQYEQLLNQLPQVFVGSASRLLPMVELMCTEIALSFKESGFTCPPWRHAKSMSSKWFPTKSHDRLISHSSVSSQAKSSSSSGSISDDEFVTLLECVSPEGPLVPYSEAAVTQWMKSSSQPRTSTTGFKVKSLLSSGLAAKGLKPAGTASRGWHEPTIRTVKMTGRQQVA